MTNNKRTRQFADDVPDVPDIPDMPETLNHSYLTIDEPAQYPDSPGVPDNDGGITYEYEDEPEVTNGFPPVLDEDDLTTTVPDFTKYDDDILNVEESPDWFFDDIPDDPPSSIKHESLHIVVTGNNDIYNPPEFDGFQQISNNDADSDNWQGDEPPYTPDGIHNVTEDDEDGFWFPGDDDTTNMSDDDIDDRDESDWSEIHVVRNDGDDDKFSWIHEPPKDCDYDPDDYPDSFPDGTGGEWVNDKLIDDRLCAVDEDTQDYPEPDWGSNND